MKTFKERFNLSENTLYRVVVVERGEIQATVILKYLDTKWYVPVLDGWREAGYLSDIGPLSEYGGLRGKAEACYPIK